MKNLPQQIDQLINDVPSLRSLIDLAEEMGITTWLVGGVLRDLLLERPIADIDLAAAADPTTLAKNWAARSGGRWFWLDRERKQSRVLLPKRLTVDFAPLRAPTLEADLLLRDFTINALAFKFNHTATDNTLIDPLNGCHHLIKRELHVTSRQSYVDDPLRMLKGIRHAVTLDMQLSETTVAQIQEFAQLIENVAGERIRDELGKILAAEQCFRGIRLLQETGLLRALLGPAQGSLDTEVMKALLQLEQQMARVRLIVGLEEKEPIREESFSQHSIFFLAALLAYYQPQNLPDILHRKLRLSRQQQKLILALQQTPSEHWFRLSGQLPTGRRQALLVEQLGYMPDEQLLYLSVSPNPLNFSKAIELQESFLTHQHLGRIPDILSGQELQKLLTEMPVEVTGLFLKRIKAAEITGEITDKNDVLQWLKKKITD
ncbi:MAG: hypothetical protein BA864_04460 [Desulfuromonadales bacterium C00003093]|nr:MAG: hypothetical protein BA864_04460 [Desulfuromonadales bacterium C00003093]